MRASNHELDALLVEAESERQLLLLRYNKDTLQRSKDVWA